MSLFSSLQTASTALQAFSAALGADQTNVSNASTPGFAAIRATIRPISPTRPGIGSSDIIDYQSGGDAHADALVRQQSSQSGFSQTTSSRLEGVNQLFDITGSSGILAALQQFSKAFSNLTVTPNDATLRSGALAAAGNVAAAFGTAANSLDSQKNSIDSAIGDTVSKINGLAEQIRQFNVAVRGQTEVNPATDAGLRNALETLSGLTDITVLPAADGTVSVLTGGQQPLVLADQAYKLRADLSASPGKQITSTGGGNSPGVYSGQLGALLGLRNGALRDITGDASTPGSLNQLASGFATRVNALLTSGLDATGTAGVPIFTFDSVNGSNAARTLAVDPTVTPSGLALAGTGATGGANSIATQLAALAGSSHAADLIDGISPQGFFGRFAADIGRQLADARDNASSDATSLTAAQTGRQKISGVSLDQEAVSITAYQRSYQASAKIVSILDQLTADEVNLIK
jgi:flagellar hook-associated protein 1 FlgK